MYIVKQVEIKKDRVFSVRIRRVDYDTREEGSRFVFAVLVVSKCYEIVRG